MSYALIRISSQGIKEVLFPSPNFKFTIARNTELGRELVCEDYLEYGTRNHRFLIDALFVKHHASGLSINREKSHTKAPR